MKLASGVVVAAANSPGRAPFRWLLQGCAATRFGEPRQLSGGRREDGSEQRDKITTFTAPKEPPGQQRPGDPPTPPGDEECCGSGCSRCVWLEYAEKLVDFYKDGGAKAAEAVAAIPDPNVRQFVRTELDYILKHGERP